MNKNYCWDKELVNGHWMLVCKSHEHVPMIKYNSDGTYSVRNCNGKTVVHKELKDAIKLALDTYKKFAKLNKSFVG